MRPQSNRALALSATQLASLAVAALLGLGTSGSIAAPVAVAPTSWAGAVHSRLAEQAALDPATATSDPAPVEAAPHHQVTAWARAVEARFALHAHHVAEAGRSALAWSESGVASWYGRDHAGRRTSSGARFDPMQLTCAHPTLPLGTKVLVTSDTTGQSVVVTVNDRGPFGGRIVDLSRAAAARIGMLDSGVASVTLQQATPEVVEVAQAAADDTNDQALMAADDMVNRPQHGQPHTHLAGR
ncbi:septal ring lytic transglycosylase RlpA family protein [Lichenicola cladoniae]|uniref:septal ring lytic transglycosylase RlpA family protein n=1 Tax=Lichenicola cladoniae TaxID=1484109 RepID=UPI001EF6D60F|nr:septal ring lytic transglycosylase RlpA family protein [Lichenicola cladoniae]